MEYTLPLKAFALGPLLATSPDTHSMYLTVLKSFLSAESHLDVEASLRPTPLSLLLIYSGHFLFLSPWWCDSDLLAPTLFCLVHLAQRLQCGGQAAEKIPT